MFVCVSLYLFFAFHSLNKLPLGDEIYHAAVIDRNNIYQSPPGFRNFGLWGHTPLYGGTLILLSKFFKPDYQTARMLGIFIFLFTLGAVWGIAKEVAGNKDDALKVCLLSVFLYCIHPMAIQGSLLMDRDNTFFTLFLTCFVLFFIRFKKFRRRRDYFLCVLCVTGLLWGKLASFPVVFLGFAILEGLTNKNLKERVVDMGVVAGGVLIFIVSWFLFCRSVSAPWLNPSDIFTYLFSAGKSRFSSSMPGLNSLSDIVKTFVHVVIWFNPFFLCLAALCWLGTVKNFFKTRALQADEALSVFSFVIFAGYIFYGRLMFGFPKYHYPALFLMCVGSACLLISIAGNMTMKDTAWVVFFSLGISFIYHAIVNDVFLSAYFSVKESLAQYGFVSVSVKYKIISQWGTLLACFALTWVFFRRVCLHSVKRSFLASLFVCSVSLNLSQDIFQMDRNVSTISCYGERGTGDAVKYLRARLENAHVVLTSRQILFHLGQSGRKDYKDVFFNDREKVIKELKKPVVQFFAYGIQTHTWYQLREVFHDREIIRYVEENFLRRKIGTFTVWERKK